jgi:Winged helix DNA-binding domain
MKDTPIVGARLAAQQLSGTAARTADEVAERLVAIQAQDIRGARLAVRSRSKGLVAADVDDALTVRRSLVISWLNRGTLHLVRPDDYWWLHPLTTPQLVTANRRRLRQEGVSEVQARRGVDVVVDAVRAHGPQTRTELRRRLESARIPVAGQALAHVLMAASLRGEIVRGPLRKSEHAFVAVEAWLGPRPPPMERADALALLARRYLRGHGPADAGDLAKWAGLTIGAARLAIEGARPGLVDRADGLVDRADRTRVGPRPPPRLLGPFDPLLLGWASREPFVGSHTVVTSNGIFRPCVLVDGRVVGTWGLAGSRLTVRPLEPFDRATVSALRNDALDVLRFLERPDEVDVVFEP